MNSIRKGQIKNISKNHVLEQIENSIMVERSGELIWGNTSQTFEPTTTKVSVLLSHDGKSASSGWLDRYHRIEHKWEFLKPLLETALPGGIAKSELYRIDLRTDPDVCTAILHFKTSEDIYDWYVRLKAACEIELVAPKD